VIKERQRYLEEEEEDEGKDEEEVEEAENKDVLTEFR
jgi:hypothetical protein